MVDGHLGISAVWVGSAAITNTQCIADRVPLIGTIRAGIAPTRRHRDAAPAIVTAQAARAFATTLAAAVVAAFAIIAATVAHAAIGRADTFAADAGRGAHRARAQIHGGRFVVTVGIRSAAVAVATIGCAIPIVTAA